MLLKCFLILGLVFLLEAASITKGIPVKVVYVDPVGIEENAREKSHVRYLQNRNLDEKVQLSGRELKEADQHIPFPEGSDGNDGALFLKAKTVFLDKLANFRDQVDRFSLKTTQKKPTSEDWAGLNEKIQEVFKKYEKNGIRQNQGGFFAELTQVTGQWFQSFGGNNNNKPGGEEDEQQQNQGGLGQAWTNFSNSISQAFSNIGSNNQGSTTSNTVLGDTGVTTSTQAPGFFQNIVSNLFNNNQGNNPGQEDTGVTNPPNIFQGAINNIINTFSQSSEKPNTQGDTGESSTSAPSGNPIINNISNAIGQVFGQSTKPPGASGDNEATNKPSNFFENVFQNVFNQNQASSTSQAQGTTSAPNIINQGLQQIQIPGQGGDINNIQQFQNAGQQIAQGFQNPQSIAQNLGQQVGGNSEGSQNNQLQQIAGGLQNPQNFASQAQNVGQQIGGNIPSGSQGNIGQQISEAFQNPQNFANQAQNVGQQIGGNIPSGSQGNIGQQISQAFQNPQNFASQAQNIGQQINGNGSGSQGQAVGQQISQAFQNPQNFATQAQNIGQQLGGNLPQTGQQSSGSQGGVSTLDVNQIPVIGQQLNQNSQNPIQNIQTNPTNIINQIQSSTNQVQNPAASVSNPINLVDTQNQQLNVNQINQIIPSNLQPQNSNEIQSTLTNQFNNGLNQLSTQNGGNPLSAATGILQSNQSQNGGQTSQQNVVKPVNEEKIERKVSEPVEKTKKEGEAEIMVAFER
ncbi:putative mediator of RNA polymerase II transcription subunit 29 [Coccinella septempunctata]|uniref:putative mediator of RNA polymerase II transcription subunit 29 n=1 Tax=Coccinella septempunctata TaxID=41139 RepID=UPI001D05C5AD|nr:putative mediator of RNA polymerase II transcription subunit 29 [Coccinella septempunctata]